MEYEVVPCSQKLYKSHIIMQNGEKFCVSVVISTLIMTNFLEFVKKIHELSKLFDVVNVTSECGDRIEYKICNRIVVTFSEYGFIVDITDNGIVVDDKWFDANVNEFESLAKYILDNYPDAIKSANKVAQRFVECDDSVDGSLD